MAEGAELSVDTPGERKSAQRAGASARNDAVSARVRPRAEALRDLTPDRSAPARVSALSVLSPNQREALRKRWYQMTPAERQRAIDRRQPTAPTAPRRP